MNKCIVIQRKSALEKGKRSRMKGAENPELWLCGGLCCTIQLNTSGGGHSSVLHFFYLCSSQIVLDQLPLC